MHLRSFTGYLPRIVFAGERSLEADAMPDALFIVDKSGKITHANVQAEKLLGYSRQEMVGQSVEMLVPEQLRSLHEQERAAYVASPRMRPMGKGLDLFARRKDGTIFPVDIALSPVETKEGIATIAVVRDMTEHARLKRFTEDIVATVPSGLVAIGEKSEVISVNRSFCELFGLTREQVEGKPVDVVLRTIGLSEECRAVVARRQPFRNVECACSIPGKGIATLQLTLSRIRFVEEALLVIDDITERKRVEEEIRRSHRQYEELVNSVDGIVWEADARTFQFSFVSQQAERILGYPAERWITEPTFWKDRIHPEDREWAVSFCIKATVEKRPHQFEYRMIAADGRAVWFRDNVVVVVLNDGQPQVLRGIMVEITERKRAEQEREVLYAIGETVNTTASLNELLRSIYWHIKKLMDAENCYIALYDADTDMLSFPLFVDQFDPTPAPRTKRKGLTEYVLRTGKPLLLTPELFDELVRDGEVEIMGTPPKSWLGVPLLVESQPVGVLVVQSYEPGRRYTEREKEMLVAIGNQAAIAINRKRAEETLQRTLSLLTATLESTADGILVVNTEGKIVGFNHKFLDLWRIPDSIIASRDDNQALAFVLDQLKDPDGFLKKVRELYAQPEAESYDTLEFKDGRVFERYSHPQWLAGRTVGRVWSFRDITERRKLEEQFRQAQKMESIGTLAGGIAHDFNNILGIILGHATSLERPKTDPKKLSQSIDAIAKATQRGISLVKQLLTFARKTEAIFQPVSINDIIGEITKLLAETFPKTITISTSLQPELPLITADDSQIHQVLTNLCINARDAMPRGGTISISTNTVESEVVSERFPKATARQYVQIEIADTGLGMDEATRQRIFEPFFTTKEVGKGTGLGLSVVFGIIENHNGFIDVRSTLREGTAFTVYLPVLERYPEVSQPIRQAVESIPGGRETILLIEDEEMLRELVKTVLVSKGYTVLTANDGLSGVETYQRHQSEIAVVLTDLGLPIVSGQEVFRRIREINSDAKIILASGFIEPETQSEMYKAGLKEFIQKPYRHDEVLQKVREVIDIQR